MDISSAVKNAFRANGRDLTEEQADLFSALTDRMLLVNEGMNLTAITDPEEISVKHYADCASMADVPPAGALVADIGAGAGFPTLPMAILRPDLTVVAVDSTEKRMRYVAQTAELLGLGNVSVLTARAEELGRKEEYRERFDFVTARAVAPLNVLCELCLPLLRQGGMFCALKAAGGADELRQAGRAAEILGGTVRESREFSLVDPAGRILQDALRRNLILIEKTSATPSRYPRRFARIQADPL